MRNEAEYSYGRELWLLANRRALSTVPWLQRRNIETAVKHLGRVYCDSVNSMPSQVQCLQARCAQLGEASKMASIL